MTSPVDAAKSALRQISKEAALVGVASALALQVGVLVADVGHFTPLAVGLGLLVQGILLFRVFGLASQQSVYRPQAPVTAHLWTDTTSPDFVHPELSDTEFGIPDIIARPNLGIAVSGGGEGTSGWQT